MYGDDVLKSEVEQWSLNNDGLKSEIDKLSTETETLRGGNEKLSTELVASEEKLEGNNHLTPECIEMLYITDSQREYSTLTFEQLGNRINESWERLCKFSRTNLNLVY